MSLALSPSIVGTFFLFQKHKLGASSAASSELLCRFVLDHEGKTLGESVSLLDDALIVKAGPRFFGVPLSLVQQADKALRLTGAFDLSKATALGERWLQEYQRGPGNDGDRRV